MNNMEETENQKIEKRLTTLEVLMTDTREDLKEIKDKVSNEIPHQIDGVRVSLEKKISEIEKGKWPKEITIILSILSSVAVGLIVYLATH